MSKITTKKINDNDYSRIISFLSYEINVDNQLSRMKWPESKYSNILVDLALVSGLGEFRFAKFSLDEKGKIILASKAFITPSSELEKTANKILANHKDCVTASFLSSSQKAEILNA